MMDAFRALQRLMSPIFARIRRVCMGAIIRRVDDDGNLQKMQIESLGHSVYDNVEKFGQFGFASNPPIGLDAIIVERCGKYIVVAVGDRKYRIKNLESGDTAIYDIRGQIVKLNADGITINDAFGNSVKTTKNGIDTTDINGNNVKMSSTGINMTDLNGNHITMGPGSIDINGVIITTAGAMTAPSTIAAAGAATMTTVTATDVTVDSLSAESISAGTVTATTEVTAANIAMTTHIHSGGTIDGKTGAPTI